jgi:hypothetical protein
VAICVGLNRKYRPGAGLNCRTWSILLIRKALTKGTNKIVYLTFKKAQRGINKDQRAAKDNWSVVLSSDSGMKTNAGRNTCLIQHGIDPRKAIT